MTSQIGLLSLLLCFFWTAKAQEVLFIEAPRLAEEAPISSPATTVLDRRQIEKENKTSVADLLREAPGIEVVRQGGFGQTTSLFIRGARSEDCLVLIDGIEVNDGMSPSGGFDFSNLSTQNIERIEIYRGPQTVRFGPGALGGVIQIITRNGLNRHQNGYRLEGGSYGTILGDLAIARGNETWGSSIGLEEFKTDGFSAADHKLGNSEIDGALLQSVSSKLSWQPDRTASVDLTVHDRRSKSDSDRSGGPAGDDPNDTNDFHQFMAGLKGSKRFADGKFRSTLGTFFGETTRSHLNYRDQTSSGELKSDFLSESFKVESENEWLWNEDQGLRLSLQWKNDDGGSNTSSNQVISPFARRSQSSTGEGLSFFSEGPDWFGEAGVRSDQHSRVGAIQTYRLVLGRHFETGTTLQASSGSGVKIPSLYQLYSEYGNQSLDFERVDSLELSVSQKINEQTSLSASVFRNQNRDLIDFDSAQNRYFNLARVETRGVEILADWKPSKEWAFQSNATYLDARNEVTGARLVRRPRYAVGASLEYSKNAWDFATFFRFRGARADTDPVSFQPIEQSAYEVVDLSVAYATTTKTQITFRIENLFNRQYQEAAGYGSPELSFFAGLKGSF